LIDSLSGLKVLKIQSKLRRDTVISVHDSVMQYEPEQMTDMDLLAAVIQPGLRGRNARELASRILSICNTKAEDQGRGASALTYILRTDPDTLGNAIPELSKAQIAQIIAGINLGVRATKAPITRQDVSSPESVYEWLAPHMSYLTHEQFVVVPVNAKNNTLDMCVVSKGTLTASLVHPREIFKPAIRRSAHAVILAHNHPSGDPKPSREDIEVTVRLIEAGGILGIHVLDHLVIGDGRYISLRKLDLCKFE
jgi:DNA repair protein RadC